MVLSLTNPASPLKPDDYEGDGRCDRREDRRADDVARDGDYYENCERIPTVAATTPPEHLLTPKPANVNINANVHASPTPLKNLPPTPSPTVLCRPRFSAFLPFSQNVLNSLLRIPGEDLATTTAPLYTRSDATPRYNLVTPHPDNTKTLPTGFSIPTTGQPSLPLSNVELSQLRFRGRDARRLPKNAQSNETKPSGFYVSDVQFPLLSVLLPKFKEMCDDKYANRQDVNCVKVLILVSGVGTPRNWTHSVTGNSTQACGKLMTLFVNKNHPDVYVVRVHSNTNIFRYDDNISFVKKELLPLIENYRDCIATDRPLPNETNFDYDDSRKVRNFTFDPEWKERFHLNLSFADGSPARTYAIQASLRPYRPTYMHFWQLKTFWHSDKICSDDVEVHSFEDMEVEPPVEPEELHVEIRMIVDEMKRFRKDFNDVCREGDEGSDLRQFWLRKSKKPVLAVLLARGKDGELQLFRGTNLEVSMPTGSLCAERNVIGTALANNVGMKRGDLIAVAVLAANMDADKQGDEVGTGGGSDGMRSTTVICTEIVSQEDGGTPPPSPSLKATTSVDGKPAAPLSSPTRKISLRKYSDEPENPRVYRRRTQKTIYAAHSDMNPLKPCGSCSEWLKKIAEPNPGFKVVTFTDERCNGVYQSSVAFE
jgi:cytidine deaminase